MPFSNNNKMEGAGSSGVRKGAWSEEEDLLLRKCVEKYGEGKWRQVPLRAGLNRCRKSCRLRWLNYLHPNIKRGEFATDEVDLIVRMHKLLGNRWSLIAGRLPGRTANDIKNYCNTHLKNMLSSKRNNKEVIKPSSKKDYHHQHQITSSSKLVKPLPRSFSENSKWFKAAPGITSTTSSSSKVNTVATSVINTQKSTSTNEEMHDTTVADADAAKDSLFDQFSSKQNKLSTPLWLQRILELEVDDDQDHQVGNDGNGNNGGHVAHSNQAHDFWKDLNLDDNLWQLIGEEQDMIVKDI